MLEATISDPDLTNKSFISHNHLIVDIVMCM